MTTKSKHVNGRKLAEQTGWDVVLSYPAVGQESSRGSVLMCTHPQLPGWQVGHAKRGWQLAHPDGTRLRYAYLWQAIEGGNRMIATDEMVHAKTEEVTA